MILVEEITIEELRGIRSLTLKFNGKNFAVCGPNGTGKSGVVDALEFGLTGNISRLSGGGTGAISLRKHAPHVDSRDFPEKAKVTLTLRIPSLKNKRVKLERNVANANAPTIIPNSPDVLEILKQLENHPEFVLSRRELIAYVLAQPGKRSEEIQALLRLDQIGELRSTLKTISNLCGKEEIAFQKANASTRDDLARALEIPELKTDALLEAVNKRRTILGLTAIESLTNTTALHDGLKTNTKVAGTSKVNKVEVLSGLKEIRDMVAKTTEPEISKTYKDLHTEITALSADKSIADGVSREKFLRTAISYVTEAVCPVCDTEWDMETLRSLIETKLRKYEEVTKTRSALEKRIESIIENLETLQDEIGMAEKWSKILATDQTVHFSGYHADLTSKIKALRNFLPLSDTLNALGSISSVPGEIVSALTTIESVVAAIPEPTEQEASRDYLILCQDRLERYRESARDAKRAEDHATLATSVYEIYCEVNDKILEGVYKEVEEEFGEFYRSINNDDEDAFSAKLTPSIGKLGFDVEFYGRGHFPPGAYHSEGHQDGMGLCLYLALMQRLQGKNFTFAVLDDVLMSVDTGHRREVCKLLKEHFPNTQFILTTHDEVWLKHMGTVGLISSGNSVRFSNWTPEHGPTEWNTRDIWTEIDTALKNNDVRNAASLLRYYLEHIFKDICDNLRAPVEFRGDGRYELGDVLPPAVKRLRDILLNGKRSAESWGRTADAKAIEDREKILAESFHASNAEQWQINPAMHYNEWANLSPSDFTPVVRAFHDLVQKFFCPKAECGGLYYIAVTPPKTHDALKCACGETNINLKNK